jgi:regulator of cell morphogenesis and NO signaling
VPLTREQTLGYAVIDNPACADAFEKLGIDYYSRGCRPLLEALAERGMSYETFVTEVEQAALFREQRPPSPNWRTVSLRTLVGHIVSTHHAWLRSELPALERWIAARQPAESDFLPALHGNFQRLHQTLEVQMIKEETIVFPAILELENLAAPARRSLQVFGSLTNLSRVTADQNNAAAARLGEMLVVCEKRGINHAGELKPLPARIRTLAADIHQHLHLENNVLFQRAIHLERGTPFSGNG